MGQSLHAAPGGTVPRIVFPTPTGRARFHARPCLPAPELPDDDYPFAFNTGRLPHHWHTMTKTGKIPALVKLNPKPFVEIHPEDAGRLGIRDRDRVEIRSRRGSAVVPASVTDRVMPGSCFSPFHWADVFAENAAVNAITSDDADPVSHQPGPKYCAVALCRAAPEPEGSVSLGMPEPKIAMPQIQALTGLLGFTPMPAPAATESERTYLGGFLSGLQAAEGGGARGVPVLPPNAPLRPATRLWLDGVLAGLFSRAGGSVATEGAAAPAEGETAVAVLWASQTGRAAELATRMAARLGELGHPVRASSMADYAFSDIIRERTLVLISSTTGDGEPPDDGAAFWDGLKADTAPRLEGLRFAVMALGDPRL